MDIKILPLKKFHKWWPADDPPCAFSVSYWDQTRNQHVGIMYILSFEERSIMRHLIHEQIHCILTTFDGFDRKLQTQFDKVCRMLPDDYFL